MPKERLILLILAAALFTHIMDFMIIMPLGPQLMRIFDIGSGGFSVIVSSYSFSAFASGIAASFFIDRYDRKKSFLLSYFGFIVGTIACGFANSFELLLVARSLTGLFGGIMGALVLAIVSDLIPLERRAASIGFVMAAFSVASVLGVPFGLFLSNHFDWHAPFLLLGSMGFILIIIAFYLLPPVQGHLENALKVRPWESFKRVIMRRNPQIGLLFTAVLMLGHFTIIPFIAAYMVGNVGFLESDLTYIYLVGGGLTIFTSQLIGSLADNYGRLKVFTTFGILVLIPIIWITNMPVSPLWVALIATGIFFVFANGRMVPSTTMITSVILPENRGSFMSLRSSVQQLFSGIAAIIGGLIVSETSSEINEGAIALINYEYAGYFAVIFSIITVFVGRLIKVEQGA